jgi:molecular chaperone GrpE
MQSRTEPSDTSTQDGAIYDANSPVTDQSELVDQLKRALAESDNLRKRLQRTAEDDRRFAISTFAVRLLAVEDSLSRTLKEVDEQPPIAAESVLVAGVRATERMLRDALKNAGVCRIEAMSARFDPHLHEAIAEIHDSDVETGHIAAVLEDGYMIHDRLLRPAKVSVSKR